MNRPDVPFGDPSEWEVAEAGRAWSIDPAVVARVAKTQGCRLTRDRKACGRPIVAVLFRGTTGRAYGYCGAHLYGRWIEDGRVVAWRLRS